MLKVALNGVEQVRAELDKAKKQIPFASALAINNTAHLVMDEIKREMASVFDRPTNWTLNSMRVVPAKKDHLEASVWVKDQAGGKAAAPAQWLRPQIEGGQRQDKGSESKLRRQGVLPAGKYILPGNGVGLDRFGNISRGTMRKVLTGINSNAAQASSTGKKRKGGRKNKYFVLGQGANAIGIAERMGKDSISMVLKFGRLPSYSRRLDFYAIGQRVVDKHLVAEFEKAIAYALRTAK